MSDPRIKALLDERLETVMALSRLMAEELQLIQRAAGAEVALLTGAAQAVLDEAAAALADCRARIARLDDRLDRIDSALAAPEEE